MTSKKRKYGNLSERPLPTEDESLVDDVFAAFTRRPPSHAAPTRQEPASQQVAPVQEIPASQQVPPVTQAAAPHVAPPVRRAPTPLSERPATSQEPATQQAGGWMMYPHEISDRIMRQLDAYSQSVLHQLLRLSWGHQSNECLIGLPKLAERCGFSESQARRAKKNLVVKEFVKVLAEDYTHPDNNMRGTLYRILLTPPPLKQVGGFQRVAPVRQAPNKVNTQKENTQTQGGLTAGVRVGSKFSIEECRKYAQHLQSTGQGINNPGGYATTIHRTGEADLLIESFLNPPAPIPEVDTSQCPDCKGSGFYYPNGPTGGVTKCKHENLRREN